VVWETPDPAGNGAWDLENALLTIYRGLEVRIEQLLTLPLTTFNKKELSSYLNAIGMFDAF